MPLFFLTLSQYKQLSFMNHIHPFSFAVVLMVFQNGNQTRAVLKEPVLSAQPCLIPSYRPRTYLDTLTPTYQCLSPTKLCLTRTLLRLIHSYTCIIRYTQTITILAVFVQVKFIEDASLLVTVHFVNIFTHYKAHLHKLYTSSTNFLFSIKCRIKV